MQGLKRQIWIVSVALASVTAVAQEYDFSYTDSKSGLTFFFAKTGAKTAAVIATSTDTSSGIQPGAVSVPDAVNHSGSVYDITEIEDKAFANINISGIEMPDKLAKIGDFAFENCHNLQTVTFPDIQTEVSQSAFYGCTNINKIIFGGDWTKLNLTPYKYADKLEEISIPENVESITGLEELHALNLINVAHNNMFFSSPMACLYSKDRKTLYYVPAGAEGKLTIENGTETISSGALRNCYHLEQIEFPETLKKMDYDELSNIENLQRLLFKSEQPIITAVEYDAKNETDCRPILLLEVQPTSKNVKLYIPDNAKKAYDNAFPKTFSLFKDNNGKSIEIKRERLITKDNLHKNK